MISNKKAIWLIVVIMAALAVAVALKTANTNETDKKVRGVLVKRSDLYEY